MARSLKIKAGAPACEGQYDQDISETACNKSGGTRAPGYNKIYRNLYYFLL